MTDQHILDAFDAAPRERFLPHGEVRFAGLDRPLEIGHGQTNSQPTTVRHLLEHLTTSAPPKDREVEAAKARARAEIRYAR